MSHTAMITTGLVTLTLATMALTGCTATTASESTQQTPLASPTTAAAEPETCSRMSQVVSYTDPWLWERRRPLTDLGAREFAQGEVTLDEDGSPATYTVEPGDVEAVIAERLCAYPNLGAMNHVRDLFPGQVLWLTPDPDTPWVPYYNPLDAAEGFLQIPYQDAITAAGIAVDAGDIDTVRAIWNGTLSDMFTDQDTIDAIQQVVDAGDPDALRQLFS